MPRCSRIRFRNTETSLTVPPYAAMIVVGIVNEDGRDIYQIRQCTVEDEHAQQQRQVVFNLRRAIEPDAIGCGTRVLPTWVRLGADTQPSSPDESPPDDEGPTEPLFSSGSGTGLVLTTESGSRFEVTEPEPSASVPRVLDTIGPARGTWELWPGGVTHQIERLLVADGQLYASAGLYTGAALIRIETVIEERESPTIPGGGLVRLQRVDRETSQRSDAMVNSQPMELRVTHSGPNEIDPGETTGHAKKVHNHWEIDLAYCDG